MGRETFHSCCSLEFAFEFPTCLISFNVSRSDMMLVSYLSAFPLSISVACIKAVHPSVISTEAQGDSHTPSEIWMFDIVQFLIFLREVFIVFKAIPANLAPAPQVSTNSDGDVERALI